LNDIPAAVWKPHQEYLERIKFQYPDEDCDWRELVFLETAYMVLKGGDIIKLISGINNSGKTWTTLPQVSYANWLLKNYWKVSSSADKFVELENYSLTHNVAFYPEPDKIRARIAVGSQFNCLAVNEGMKAAINIRSWDTDVIDMILELFTERASHNYITFEYQIAKRPPKLLLARFNVWEHKMSQKWMVVSMPSSVYRTDDPLYTTEIDKIKGDHKISTWFTHKSGNVNFITNMIAPKMTEWEDIEFKRLRKIAKEEYDKGKQVKKSLGTSQYKKIDEYWHMVNEGQIAYMKLPELLREAHGFNDDEIKKFMTAFNKFGSDFKLLHPQDKIDWDRFK
jgi:hypothetical protein